MCIDKRTGNMSRNFARIPESLTSVAERLCDVNGYCMVFESEEDL